MLNCAIIMGRLTADWNAWARMWQRPAAIRAHMENKTEYKDYRR